MKVSSREKVAVIPAGGIGKRMKPLQIWKELIPLGYKTALDENKKEIRVPKVISEYIIENMKNAGVDNLYMVVNTQKTELIRFYGDGNGYDVNMAYLIQDLANNLYAMPVALDIAYPFVKDKDVFFGMPDTVVKPSTCFRSLYKAFIEEELDLALGVFPSDNPKELAPVEIGKNGEVLGIYDKPKSTKIYNSWNVAVWSPKFTELLHSRVLRYIKGEERDKGELLMSSIFMEAVEKGLKAKAIMFPEGMCYDIGCTDKLYNYLLNNVYNDLFINGGKL
ncbi:sugar phosphate nucleotidyltransferase [Clostridium hydrogeniformans]|uniref:sugar phosphate nucleotidyltransferase n=1 Tax=Clostridium hydrogeniformans TaxID=349933 RepID=UPI000489A7F4|nr:sugar phosphate nucleotidyltransferase [Clostridium hydrogeniformans]